MHVIAYTERVLYELNYLCDFCNTIILGGLQRTAAAAILIFVRLKLEYNSVIGYAVEVNNNWIRIVDTEVETMIVRFL